MKNHPIGHEGVVLVTGISASGKSTVGELLACRLERAAFIEGDVMWKLIVTGREDIVLEADLERYRHWVTTRPLRIVVLRPHPDVVVARERERGTSAYRDWVDQLGSLESAVAGLDSSLERSPKLGLWIDSSNQTPDQTVDEMLDRWDRALVTP